MNKSNPALHNSNFVTSQLSQKWFRYILMQYDTSGLLTHELMHLGVGLLRAFTPGGSPPIVQNYDAAGLLGFNGSALGHGFPLIQGLGSSDGGGMSPNMGPTNLDVPYYTKETGVGSLTWVHGTHTYKARRGIPPGELHRRSTHRRHRRPELQLAGDWQCPPPRGRISAA